MSLFKFEIVSVLCFMSVYYLESKQHHLSVKDLLLSKFGIYIVFMCIFE